MLEYLIKNGSERIVDDARSHLALIRMLRQFHFIDMNGKDQGLNVRNRSSELVKLLGDVDLIRAERKKAKNNRHKFTGFEGGIRAGGGGMMSSSGRYGGFGSDSSGYGGYSGGVYGDGGGFGGQDSSEMHDTGPRASRFEEYDEYDEGDAPSSSRPREPATRAKPPAKKPEPAPAPVADLFDFGDDEPATMSSTAAGKQPASNLNMLDSTPADDDEFDDFQSATPAPQATLPASKQFAIPPPASTASTTASTQFAAPQPISASQGANINGLVGFTSATPTPTSSGLTSPMQAPMQQPKPMGYQAATPNYFTSVSIPQQTPQPKTTHGTSPSVSSVASPTANPAAFTAKKPSGDAFGSLWSTASASAGIQKTNTGANKGPNLNSMAREKASAGIWGAPATTSQQQPKQPQNSSGSAFDDLLG